MICKNCLFYCQDGADRGTCRRYPPTPVLYAYAVFPKVESNSAKCGEFQSKEKQTMKRKGEK